MLSSLVLPMHSVLAEPILDSDIASKFWTSPASHRAENSFRARNLYELFVHDLSTLVSGASQAHREARALYRCLPADQLGLRRVVLGLARASRACLPRLPVTLLDEGLVLPPAHDATVAALLSTIDPQGCAAEIEPWSVVGARLVSAFHKLSLHLEAQAVDASENASLLGSVALQENLRYWADRWNDYVVELRSREPTFRALAYAAGVVQTDALWQFA